MAAVLLSNPGLPLAIYGNPGRRGRKAKRVRRTVRFFVAGRKARKNPVYRASLHDGFATTKSVADYAGSSGQFRKLISSRFPGWTIQSIHTEGASPRKRTHMAKTRRRSRRVSHRKASFQRRRARYTVGRTYRRKGAWIRVQRASIRKRKGKRIKHPAVKWSGRKGKIVYFGISARKGRKGIRRARFTNPRRRRGRRTRRNPVGAYVGGLTAAPGRVFNTVKSMNIKNIGFLGGGAVVAYGIGGLVTAYAVRPLLEKIPAVGNLILGNPLAARVVGAAMPYTAAFFASRFIKKAEYKSALLLGGALASIVELLVPGKVAELVGKVPGVASLPRPVLNGLAGPCAGMAGIEALAGYVEAPSYSGVGAYVEAPSYSGVGNTEALAGYVEAPSYSGVGDDALAGYLEAKDGFLASSYLDG